MHLPIMWKLIVSFVLAILIPMLLTTSVSLELTTDQLEQQLRADGLVSLRHAQNELSRRISSADAIAEFLADTVSFDDNALEDWSRHQYLDYFREFSSNVIIEIFNGNKQLVARSRNSSSKERHLTTLPEDPILTKALDLEKTTDFFSYGSGIAIKVSTPVVELESLESTGIVVVTIPVNSIFVQDLKSRARAEIAIQWNAGGDVFSTFLNRDGTAVSRIWEGARVSFTSTPDEVVQEPISISNRSFLVSSSLLTTDTGRVVGILSAGVNSEKLRRSKESLYRVIFISSLVFLIFAILAGIALSRTFTMPITTLARTMTEVAEGNLDKRVAIPRSDEIGDLANSFNEMTHKLQRSFASNEKQKTEIEKLQVYLSNIINSMPSVLIGVDVEERITQWNKKAEELTGIPVDQALENSLANVIPHMTSKSRAIQESISTRTTRHSPREPYETDNSVHYQDITIYPLITNGTEGAVIRIDDVTREHNLELQLSQSRKMDAIGELAGGIAHDFNNMLAGILGAADLLALSVGDKGRRHLDILVSAAQRAADLTSKLLTFSRQTNMEMSPLNIHTTIMETISLLERTIDKKIVISCRFNTEKPVIRGNNTQLQNALLNIGINAAHAMDNSGELMFAVSNLELSDAECSASEFSLFPGRYLAVDISDTGCGIPPAIVKRIFEPFFTTKKSGKGTGLGLAAVYGIVQEHGGAITVTSDPGAGSTFRMLLPAIEGSASTAVSEDKLVKGIGKLLLVEDEDTIREATGKMLEHLGYEVVMAQDGQEAVDLFGRLADDIDLVILDMIMPRMGGAETFQKLRKIRKGIRIIIATGFVNNEELARIRNCNIDGIIEKPFRASALSQLIAKVLANNR